MSSGFVRRSLKRPALLEDVAAEPVGDPVQHDRRDHLVRADGRLQEPRDPRPDRSRGCRHRDPEQDVCRAGHVHGGDAYRVGADQPDEVLAVAADVEQAAAEGERYREADENQRGRLKQRLAEVVGRGVRDVGLPRVRQPVQARSIEDVPVRLKRVVARREDDEAADQEGDDPGDDRRDPAACPLGEVEAGGDGRGWRLGRSPRARFPSAALAARSSRSLLLRGAQHLEADLLLRHGARVLADDPSLVDDEDAIREREHFLELQGQEQDRPSLSRSWTSRRWRYSIAPTSSPRVGWAATSTFGSLATSRAATTFCWLPPERANARVLGPPPRTSNSSISLRARSTRRRGKSQPKREAGGAL